MCVVVSSLVLGIYGLLVQKCVCDLNGLAGHSRSNFTDYYDVKNNSYVFQKTPDIIRRYGYPVETHTVTTEDGYVLTVHRIPGSPRAAPGGVKTPVLLQHGLGTSGECYLLLGPEKSIGFLLADQGYDVWLGNSRGNFYSRKHLTLSPKDPKFWQFTWHEMGVYDLPAVIDHILETTNQKQLFCIGHSMGTTVFFVLASTRPEYNQKIRLMVNLAPTVYYHPLRSKLLVLLSRNIKLISGFFKQFGIHEFAPRLKSVQILLGHICREGNPLLELCMLAFFAALGYHRESFDTTIAPMVFSHGFAGASANAVLHYAENYLADRFQIYDPSVTPGLITRGYNLSQVSAPVSLLYAENDIQVHPNGVMRLKEELPNVVSVYRVPDDLASHVDFILAKNLNFLVNDEVIAELNKYNR